MPDAPPNPLAYAEEVLGVHKVFDEANVLDATLNDHLTALDKAQDSRRAIDLMIEERDMELLIHERGQHPDHSEAAMERHLKIVRHRDHALQSLRAKRVEAAATCAGIELDIKYTESRLRTMTARMHELGGYFNFLAMTKLAAIQAEQTHKTEKQETK